MPFLIIVSLLWALTFGLMAQVSDLGAVFVAAARTLTAALVFLPFINIRGLKLGTVLALAGTGGLQFGVMFVAYVHSYRWLQPAEVALFTMFVPVFVTLAEDLLARRFSVMPMVTSALAVAGTGVCLWTSLDRRGLYKGFIAMQVCNLCFAVGQVLYRRIAPATGKADHQLMGILFVGAASVALAMAAPSLSWPRIAAITWRQGWILLYLGVVASGIGFFLFNAGARRTDVGTLAIFNNAKVFLGVLAAGLLFQQKVDWPRLWLGGGVIIGAWVLNHHAVNKGRSRIAPRP
jgi:drug/metabolite transporter (DMT)-like permease